MSIEQQITALLEQADPLRALAEGDAGKLPLNGFIVQINALRARQSAGEADPAVEQDKPKRSRSVAIAEAA